MNVVFTAEKVGSLIDLKEQGWFDDCTETEVLINDYLTDEDLNQIEKYLSKKYPKEISDKDLITFMNDKESIAKALGYKSYAELKEDFENEDDYEDDDEDDDESEDEDEEDEEN